MDVFNDVLVRCVFERHDVKSQDHCSVPLEKTAFGGHASLQPADPCSTDLSAHPAAACPRPMIHAGQKCPPVSRIRKSWMLNELCLEPVPQKSLRERGLENKAVDVKCAKKPSVSSLILWPGHFSSKGAQNRRYVFLLWASLLHTTIPGNNCIFFHEMPKTQENKVPQTQRGQSQRATL